MLLLCFPIHDPSLVDVDLQFKIFIGQNYCLIIFVLHCILSLCPSLSLHFLYLLILTSTLILTIFGLDFLMTLTKPITCWLENDIDTHHRWIWEKSRVTHLKGLFGGASWFHHWCGAVNHQTDNLWGLRKDRSSVQYNRIHSRVSSGFWTAAEESWKYLQPRPRFLSELRKR